MSDGEKQSSDGWRSPERREELRDKIDRYADIPLAVASIVLVLLTLIELSGELTPVWARRLAVIAWFLWSLFLIEFVVKFVLAPVKRRYLRRHWLDALVVLIPVLRILRLARIVRIARAARTGPIVSLLTFGGRGSQAAFELLRRRRLGQLALVTALVILLGAGLGFLIEAGAPGSAIRTFGDALWWSAALITTVGSQLNPVTPAGRVLGFVLMLYAMAVFTYFTASVASVLIGADVFNPPAVEAEQPSADGRRVAAERGKTDTRAGAAGAGGRTERDGISDGEAASQGGRRPSPGEESEADNHTRRKRDEDR